MRDKVCPCSADPINSACSDFASMSHLCVCADDALSAQGPVPS